MKECEVVPEDYIVSNVEEERSNAFAIKMNMQIMNMDMTIFEKMCNGVSKRQEKDCHH